MKKERERNSLKVCSLHPQAITQIHIESNFDSAIVSPQVSESETKNVFLFRIANWPVHVVIMGNVANVIH